MTTILIQGAGNYGYKLTLLVMPEAERRWRRRDVDEEPVEDSYDRVRTGGRGSSQSDVSGTTIGKEQSLD